MIIPDTSVWIECFKGKEPYAFMMRMLMEDQKILATEVVFAELLQGAKGKREVSLITRYWDSLPKEEVKGAFLLAGIESRKQKWLSKGVGLIDAVLIVQARKARAKVWSLDKKLNNLLNKGERYKTM